MIINVKYSNLTKKTFNSFDDITDNDNVITLYCSNNNLTYLPENMNFPNLKDLHCFGNNLTHLPENMNFPNLKRLYCSNNNLTYLPDNMNFPNLQELGCRNNKLTHLPENMNFPNLEHLWCYNNKLTHLPENMNFPNLKRLHCSNNNLKPLPENMNFPNLQELYCSNNNLTYLPENMNFPNLEHLHCSHNKLTHLPLWLMNCRYLEYLEYRNNEIVLSPQMTRFINRLRQGNLQSLSIYNDGQNIHNSNIQLSVKESIDRITTRLDLVTYNKDKLHTIIIEDDILNCKEQLIEYCNDDSVHSLLLLTFPEVLWYVLMTIIKDFNIDTQQEIKSILNDEMKETMCKCFTGRMSRIINCLNGFSELVQIEIKNESQIGNIIVLVRDRLIDNYSIEKHKEEVRIELEERGYSSETIEEWVSYIE